jgi:small subunit ribosomal protein S17
MAEEEKQETEDTATPAEEQPAAEEEQAAEEAADEAEAAEGDAAGASDEVAEDAAEPAAPPEPEPAGNGADGEASGREVSPEASGGETLSPKQLRKLERSRAAGPPRPSRSPEERAAERADHRRAAAERRRRYRAARRAKRGEPGSGPEPAQREPGSRKVRQGMVVSTGGDKTITVEIAVVRRHPTYEKVVRRTTRLRAHDEANQAGEGDVVRVVESRPISRTKRWRLLDVVERAPR